MNRNSGLALLVMAALSAQAEDKKNLTALADAFKPKIERSTKPRVVEGVHINSFTYVGNVDGTSRIHARVTEEGIEKIVILENVPYKNGVERNIKIYTIEEKSDDGESGSVLDYTQNAENRNVGLLWKGPFPILSFYNSGNSYSSKSDIFHTRLYGKEINSSEEHKDAKQKLVKWRRILDAPKYEARTGYRRLDELVASLPTKLNREHYDIHHLPGATRIFIERKDGQKDPIAEIQIAFDWIHLRYVLTDNEGKEHKYSVFLVDRGTTGNIDEVGFNQLGFTDVDGKITVEGRNAHKYTPQASRRIMMHFNSAYASIREMVGPEKFANMPQGR